MGAGPALCLWEAWEETMWDAIVLGLGPATCLDDPAAANEAYRKTTRVLRGYMMRQWDYVAGLSPRFARLRLG